jgi:hypothetical protein
MSVMERRLQLLLDQHRYDLVAAEAQRSGRSVAAVIREAIDQRFDDAEHRRMAAARRFLDLVDDHRPGPEPEWAETKALMEQELEEKLARADQ